VAQVNRWIDHRKASGRGAKSRDDVLRLASRTFYNGGVGNENGGTLHVDARGAKARFISWAPGR
jgi:hypothetical protein